MENNFDSFDDICVEEIEGCEAHEAEADYDAEQAELLQKVQDDLHALPCTEYGYVTGITHDLLERMMDVEFMDITEDTEVGKEGACNLAYFIGFMETYPKAVAEAICNFDADGKCTYFRLKALEYRGRVTKAIRSYFIEEFHNANDFVVEDDYLYCWYH